MFFYTTDYSSHIGAITIASDGNSLVGLWLEGQKYFGANILKHSKPNDDLGIFASAKSWLNDYFAGKQPDIKALSLAPIGSEFRQSVWKILCEIPYGATISYGDIAQKIAQKLGKQNMSAQAVGGAVGHNPISIIIPCHRVVGKNNNLTGYAGGIDKKIALLKHEGAAVKQN